jgi:hypothetical protein
MNQKTGLKKTPEVQLPVFPSISSNLSQSTLAKNTQLACSSLGIRRVYAKGKQSTESLMSEKIAAASVLRIMAVSGQSLIKGHKEELVAALRDRSAVIQVLVAEPYSQFVDDVEKTESMDRVGQISPEITQTDALLREYLAEARESTKGKKQIGRVLVGNFTTHLRASILVCDDQWCWYKPNIPPKRAVETFSLELIEQPSGLLRDCIIHFERIWKLMEDAGRTRELK